MRLISLLLGRNVVVQGETEMHPVTAVHSGSLRKLHPDINTKRGEGKKIKKVECSALVQHNNKAQKRVSESRFTQSHLN